MLHLPANSLQPRIPSTLTHIWPFSILHPHSSNVPIILTYTTSESVQLSDWQLPNSYWGIIDICCHSVAPVAWLYSGYHSGSPTMISIINRLLRSIFPAIHCFKCSRCHPPLRHSHQHPLHASYRPNPRPSETPIPPVQLLET